MPRNSLNMRAFGEYLVTLPFKEQAKFFEGYADSITDQTKIVLSVMRPSAVETIKELFNE